MRFEHRSAQRGGTIHITAAPAFQDTMQSAMGRISSVITSKLDDFFGLSEYEWTPPNRESGPSMYLYELINWLTTVLDSLMVKDTYKDEAYKAAVQYIADCLLASRRRLTSMDCSMTPIDLQDFLVGNSIKMLNENAISNILVDLDFLDAEFNRIGRSHLTTLSIELRQVRHVSTHMMLPSSFRTDCDNRTQRYCAGVPPSRGKAGIICCS